MNHELVDGTAWRVDFSDVFEKFVQYIFKETAKEIGGRLYSNFKFHSRSSGKYSWELKHIEPDAIYQKNSLLVFIDAKYKSNLFNKFDLSDALKEEHRRDLHQIMAYSSFGKTINKFGFLCYPSDKVEMKSIRYKNGINDTESTVLILGVPLNKNSIRKTKNILTDELNHIENWSYQA